MPSNDPWSGKTIEITKVWGPDPRFLKAPNGGHATFSLKRYEGTPASYHVIFKDGQMPDCWQTAWLLQLGSGPVPPNKGGPAPRPNVDRLVGFMQVVVDGKKRTDQVWLEYQKGSNPDLVVVHLAYAEGYVVTEEGGGSGPPH